MIRRFALFERRRRNLPLASLCRSARPNWREGCVGESPVHLGRTLFRKRVVTHCFSGFSAAAANELFSSLHVPSLAGLQFISLYLFLFIYYFFCFMFFLRRIQIHSVVRGGFHGSNCTTVALPLSNRVKKERASVREQEGEPPLTLY